MVKASLWMHKSEYSKIVELSDDMSISLFLMRIIRKEIAAAEREQEEQNKGVRRLQATNLRATSTTPHPPPFLPSNATQSPSWKTRRVLVLDREYREH